MRAALKPTDFIEEGWVQDFVYHTFEIIRFRTLKAKLFAVRANATMIDVLEGLLSEQQFDRASRGFAEGREKWVSFVERRLDDAGYDAATISALALADHFDEFDRLDRMALTAERRRDEVLREVHRHRAALAEHMRRIGGEIEDAEFEEVASPQLNAPEAGEEGAVAQAVEDETAQLDEVDVPEAALAEPAAMSGDEEAIYDDEEDVVG